MGVGNTGMMVKPWEWMNSAKKCGSREMKRKKRFHRMLERVVGVV